MPAVFASDAVLKLPCNTFVCTKLEILEWKEPATRSNVTSVTDSTGKNVGMPLSQQLIDAVFAPIPGPATATPDTPEKHFPTTFTYDTCPKGCSCPPNGTNWGAPQDANQDVEYPVSAMVAGTPQRYTLTITLKVKRRIGTAKCV